MSAKVGDIWKLAAIAAEPLQRPTYSLAKRGHAHLWILENMDKLVAWYIATGKELPPSEPPCPFTEFCAVQFDLTLAAHEDRKAGENHYADWDEDESDFDEIEDEEVDR